MSLARIEYDLAFGFPLLIADDPINLLATGGFGFDLQGEYLSASISRSNVHIAGTDLHVQAFQTWPQLASSNGLRIRVAP